MNNPFFKNYGPFKVSDILDQIEYDNLKSTSDEVITDIKDLSSAYSNHITFFIPKNIK